MEEPEHRHRERDARQDDLEHQQQRENAVATEPPPTDARHDSDDEEKENRDDHGQRTGAVRVETVVELRQRFGAVSAETQVIRGHWQHEGQLYRDDLARVFVDVPDAPESRQFFVELKERLKAHFRQIDIWIISYPVEVL